jgi:hypothetical protein
MKKRDLFIVLLILMNVALIILTDSVRIEQSEYEEFLHLLRKTIY